MKQSTLKKVLPKQITRNMLAPCGLICTTCYAYLREKNRCHGCRGSNEGKPKHCLSCVIATCDKRKKSERYCDNCDSFPCPRLKRLDKRYREKWQTSLIKNLEEISKGVNNFIEKSRKEFTCVSCGGVLCVHLERCVFCFSENPLYGENNGKE